MCSYQIVTISNKSTDPSNVPVFVSNFSKLNEEHLHRIASMHVDRNGLYFLC